MMQFFLRLPKLIINQAVPETHIQAQIQVESKPNQPSTNFMPISVTLTLTLGRTVDDTQASSQLHNFFISEKVRS